MKSELYLEIGDIVPGLYQLLDEPTNWEYNKEKAKQNSIEAG